MQDKETANGLAVLLSSNYTMTKLIASGCSGVLNENIGTGLLGNKDSKVISHKILCN